MVDRTAQKPNPVQEFVTEQTSPFLAQIPLRHSGGRSEPGVME